LGHHDNPSNVTRIKNLEDLQIEDFSFLCESANQEIRDAHSLNSIVFQGKVRNNNCTLTLKVVIKDKKKFSDWLLNDMFRAVLKSKYKSLTGMPVLDPRLLSTSVSFNESEIEIFVVELKATLEIFETKSIRMRHKNVDILIFS
jgi:hypothetical protein